jgi:hypothetical protein
MRIVALLLVLFASIAHADKKPTIAVLGVMPDDTSIAKQGSVLDDTLRTLANSKASPYRVKGKAKQIADAVRTAECSVHEASCAVKLADGLDTDFTLAGKLEKRAGSVELTLYVVDADKRQIVRQTRHKVAADSDMKKLARNAFDKLGGGGSSELVIVANAKRGKVIINGELRAELFEARATLSLPHGRHKLRIEAPGHKAYEDIVVIEAPTTMNVLLD